MLHENSPVEISMKFTSEAAEQHQGHRGTLGQIAGRRGHQPEIAEILAGGVFLIGK
jgi:hypothetical protein